MFTYNGYHIGDYVCTISGQKGYILEFSDSDKMDIVALIKSEKGEIFYCAVRNLI